jgi:hypothetical protein
MFALVTKGLSFFQYLFHPVCGVCPVCTSSYFFYFLFYCSILQFCALPPPHPPCHSGKFTLQKPYWAFSFLETPSALISAHINRTIFACPRYSSWTALPLEIGPIKCPETSGNYPPTLHKNPAVRRPQ